MTDLTYADVIFSLLVMQQLAEEEAEQFRARQSSGQVDELAAAGVDTASLEDLARVDDAIADQEKTARATAEAAAVAARNIKRRHGDINDAAHDAPAEMADADFYSP